MNQLQIEKEQERLPEDKNIELSPEDYERKDVELANEPEYKHLVKVCANLGLKI